MASMSIWVRDITFNKIAPSLAEVSEYIRRAKTTGSTGCSATSVCITGVAVGVAESLEGINGRGMSESW